MRRHLDLSALITGKIGVLQLLVVSINTPAFARPSIVFSMPASASGFRGHCVFQGSCAFDLSCIRIGLADFISPTFVSC